MVWEYEDNTKTLNTYVINDSGERVWIPDIISGTFPGITEVTLLEEMKAQGWTASFGCGASQYPYRPPAGWMCDTSVPEIYGGMGTHGGCSNCVMIHLGVKVIPEYEQVVQQFLHPTNNTKFIVAGAIILGMLLFRKR